jgi:hypothetical protein
LQRTINQGEGRSDILSELTERPGSVGKDDWVVTGDTQRPSCKIDALFSGVVCPSVLMDTNLADYRRSQRRSVIRVPLQRLLA